MKKYKFLAALTLMISLAGNVHAADVGDVAIHGFLSQGYMVSTDNNFLTDTERGSFEFNEVGINFYTWLTSDLRAGIQLFARDLGDLGNDEITIDWAYADYHWRDWLGLRVGKIKVAHGFFNETRDVDMLRVSILQPESLYPEMFRDNIISMKGGGIYGKTPSWPIGAFFYQLTVGTVEISADGGAAKLGAAQGASTGTTVSGFDVSSVYNGSLRWLTPLDGLKLGGSLYTISFDVSFENQPSVIGEWDRIYLYTGGLEYVYGELIFVAEYVRQDDHAKINVILPSGNFPVMSLSKQSDGWYASVAYRFNDYFMANVYYSESYANIDDRDNRANTLKDVCTTLRFDLNESWVAKVEHHMMRGKPTTYAIDNPDGMKNKWHLFAAKLTYTF